MSMKNRLPSGRETEKRTRSHKGRLVLVAALLICVALSIGVWTRFIPLDGKAANLSGNVLASIPSSHFDVPGPMATIEAGPPPYVPFPSPTTVPPEQVPDLPLPEPPQARSLLISNSTPYNVAWGVESADSLTIWLGVLDKNGSTLSNARAIAEWGEPFKLTGISPSPDGRSIAVMFISKAAVEETEGIFPNWVAVINLSTASVQAVPDYKHYDLYKQFYNSAPHAILGWRDNNTIVLQQIGAAPVVASADGASYSTVSFPQSSVGQVALSADGKTFFSSGIDRTTYEYRGGGSIT